MIGDRCRAKTSARLLVFVKSLLLGLIADRFDDTQWSKFCYAQAITKWQKKGAECKITSVWINC